jgi:Protein of unknown function (DUF3011)/Peptidase inhibitor family I36
VRRAGLRLPGLIVLAMSVASMMHAKQMRPTPQTLTCGSRGNHRAYCAADTRGGAILVQQMSQAPCVQGRSWGFDARGIWVQNGCRAQFQVGQYGNPVWGNPGPGHRPPRPHGAGACFYKDAHFSGDYFCMRRGDQYNNLPPGFNDTISSIKVFGGAQVDFYSDSNFRNRHQNTRRDVSNLRNMPIRETPNAHWNDRISSIQVR